MARGAVDRAVQIRKPGQQARELLARRLTTYDRLGDRLQQADVGMKQGDELFHLRRRPGTRKALGHPAQLVCCDRNDPLDLASWIHRRRSLHGYRSMRFCSVFHVTSFQPLCNQNVVPSPLSSYTNTLQRGILAAARRAKQKSTSALPTPCPRYCGATAR